MDATGLEFTTDVEAVDPHLELVMAWAAEKPDERGYPHVMAALLAVIRAVEAWQGRQS